MLHEDEIQILKELGLTHLQAKVYLAFTRLGSKTAGEVAEFSKVARQEVYRINKELVEVGLISKILGTPTKFKPLPLSEGISVLLDRRIEKTSKLQTKVEELFKKDANIIEKKPLTGYRFEMVPKNAPWFRNNHIRFASYKKFDLLTSFKRFSSRIIYDKKPFSKGAEKGTEIRILTEKPPHDSPILPIINNLRKHLHFKIRFVSSFSNVVLIIMDQKEVALALTPSHSVGPPYLVSNHPSFVFMAQKYFEKRWGEAIENSI